MTNQVLPPELAERVRGLSDEALALVLEAFRVGRTTGVDHAAQELGQYCSGLMAELETRHDELTPERAKLMDELYEGVAPSPVTAAYFGGASEMVDRLQSKLRRLVAP